ncbi:MAG: sialate O-acetylesterase, partial [Kiritimatiellaeota bacterium]|nr:sialate O-acetylesterase [Kiritimatiellota bacterium]
MITKLYRMVAFLGVITWASGASAELRLAAVFSDNMVLQQNKKVPIWGWADAGEVIVVEFNGQKKETKAVADGKWMVELDSMTAKAEGGVLQVSSLKTPAAV